MPSYKGSTDRSSKQKITTVEPLASNHPKCQAYVVAYWLQVIAYKRPDHMGCKF